MKNYRIILLVVIFMIFPAVNVSAFELTNIQTMNPSSQDQNVFNRVLQEQIDKLSIDSLEKSADQVLRSKEIDGFSVKETLHKIITGKMDWSLKTVYKLIAETIFKEFTNNIRYIIEILIISILCALLKNLSDAFSSKSIANIAFYSCYIVLIILITDTFTITMKMALSTINEMKLFMDALVPTIMTMLIATGNLATSSFFQPIILASLEFITWFIQKLIIPFIYLMLVLQIINYISNKKMITKLINIMKNITKWSLVSIVSVFLWILAFQGITAPVIDSLGAKTAKMAVGNFIPIVGEVMADSVDIILNCSLIIKNGIGIVGVLFIGMICFLPIIKIISITLVYKCSAALIEPISEKNVVDCLSDVGNSCGMILASVVATTFMFIVSVTALIGAGNITSMLR